MTIDAVSTSPQPRLAYLLGFDPGRDKCGVAVMSFEGRLHYHEVIPAAIVIPTLQTLLQQFSIAHLILGDQTTAKQWQNRLTQQLQPCPSIQLVDERYTTLEARKRYWQMYPPQGLMRLVPEGMRQPPRAIDDIVAILLIERYLAAHDWAQSGGSSGRK